MNQLINGVDYPGIAVCYYVHDGKGNFVMNLRSPVCRDEHLRWDIGGGAKELHETVEQTLRQEIKQEYCAEVISFELLGYRDLMREQDGKKIDWVCLDFKVLVDPDQVHNGEPHKFLQVEWFRLDNLPSPLHSGVPMFLEKHMEKLRKA